MNFVYVQGGQQSKKSPENYSCESHKCLIETLYWSQGILFVQRRPLSCAESFGGCNPTTQNLQPHEPFDAKRALRVKLNN